MSTSLDLSKLSLMDALDLAKLIEMEACHRYQMFASQLGRTGGYDAGAFFAGMAENEAKHGQELEARRKTLFGDAPARLTLDDLYDVEAPRRRPMTSTTWPCPALPIPMSGSCLPSFATKKPSTLRC